MPDQRVAVVFPQMPYVRGGAELHAELCAEALGDAGYDVELVTAPYVWAPDRTALEQALGWRTFNLREDLTGKGTAVDLVVCTKYPSYLVRHPNKVAWVFHQQRNLYDLHGTAFGAYTVDEDDQALRQALIDLDLVALAEARALFSNSHNVARRLQRYCGFAARPLYAPPPLHGELRCGPYEDYLFFVGRLDPIKRVDLTLRALARTRNPVRLRIAGKGPARRGLEELVEELDIAERVEFLGFVSDDEVVDLYASAFAVALTPHDEDYGFTTLEAFFAGRPVVTTADAGGILEFVEEGSTGFVVEPEPEAIAERIDALYEDRALCERLGHAGRERVRELVRWDLVVDALTETLR